MYAHRRAPAGQPIKYSNLSRVQSSPYVKIEHNKSARHVRACVKKKIMETQSTKRLAIEAIESSAAALKELSSGIWRRPELAFEEEHAHALLTQFLEDRGFQVERRFGLSTAFRATSGVREEGGGNVAVICEYDALPGIGHACGHNLIAEAGIYT